MMKRGRPINGLPHLSIAPPFFHEGTFRWSARTDPEQHDDLRGTLATVETSRRRVRVLCRNGEELWESGLAAFLMRRSGSSSRRMQRAVSLRGCHVHVPRCTPPCRAPRLPSAPRPRKFVERGGRPEGSRN